MKRPLLLIVALVIAVAPALADICRLDCERARQPECPLHQQAPHKCAHDHTIGSATLTRATVDAPRPVGPAIAITPSRVTIEPIVLDLSRIQHHRTPPHRSPHIDVLRI